MDRIAPTRRQQLGITETFWMDRLLFLIISIPACLAIDGLLTETLNETLLTVHLDACPGALAE